MDWSSHSVQFFMSVSYISREITKKGLKYTPLSVTKQSDNWKEFTAGFDNLEIFKIPQLPGI